MTSPVVKYFYFVSLGRLNADLFAKNFSFLDELARDEQREVVQQLKAADQQLPEGRKLQAKLDSLVSWKCYAFSRVIMQLLLVACSRLF